MLEFLQLNNVGPASEMTLNFSPRLNLVTGDNGLGKSFLLDAAWWALTRRWPQEVNPKLASGYAAQPTDMRKPAKIAFTLESKTKSISYESVYSARDTAWIGKAGRPWNPGLVIYAHANGGFSVWDPARNYWKEKGNIDIQERHRLPGYVFSEREVWDGLELDIESKRTVICNGLIRDWSGWIKEKGDDSRNMEEVLKMLSPSIDSNSLLIPGPLTRPFVDDAREFPSLQMPYDKQVPIIFASSGVRRILALAYVLLWAWKEHLIAADRLGEARTKQVILLFDEIESHLHPRWQRTILSSILGLTRLQHATANIQLIAATHSPLVLASAEPLFDPAQDSWFDLDLVASPGNGAIEPQITKKTFVRRGDVSNWLTSDAFDLKSARSREAEVAIEQAKRLLRQGTKPTLDEASKVDQALRQAALSDIDPFWVRWGAFMERVAQP